MTFFLPLHSSHGFFSAAFFYYLTFFPLAFFPSYLTFFPPYFTFSLDFFSDSLWICTPGIVLLITSPTTRSFFLYATWQNCKKKAKFCPFFKHILIFPLYFSKCQNHFVFNFYHIRFFLRCIVPKSTVWGTMWKNVGDNGVRNLRPHDPDSDNHPTRALTHYQLSYM